MYPPGSTSLASQRLKFRLVFTIGVVVFAQVLTWLIMGESSPFHDYLVRHSGLPDAWSVTLIVPFMVSAVITGNPHAPSTVLFILASTVQWFVLAYLLSGPIANLFIRFKNK